MFTIAGEKCPEGLDWEARFNILVTCLELGRLEEASAAFKGFDLEFRQPDDKVKIPNLQASIFSRQRRWRDVITLLRDLYDHEIGNAATAIHLADAYEQMRDFTNAIRVLASESGRLQDNNLYHHLATLYVRLGELYKAIEIYRERLLNDRDRPSQMMTDYVLILRHLGHIHESRDVCERTIALPRPQKDSEFYFSGLAHYLLGRHEHARVLYGESGQQELYYDKLA